MSYKIGIDVGGTNTDAVIVDADGRVVAATKSATTPDPFDGIRESLAKVIAGIDAAQVSQAMLGTTHPANAIIQRRDLQRVGVLRLAAPASLGVRPCVAWPRDLLEAIVGPAEIVGGGNEFDGSEIAPLDEDAVRRFAKRCAGAVAAIAISAPFSPATFDHEQRAAQIIAEELGAEVAVSMSHRVGALGLLERENATILNASLLGVARNVVDGFQAALAQNGLDVESFITQNDGTLLSADEAVRFPVLTLGSGPTNSMRGACSLAGLGDALVIDVGGTSADVGILVDGFPRESTAAIEVGGVRTNFRMPDILALALGGGTVIGPDAEVGPRSVGYRIPEEALIFGGDTPTMTDAGVLAGRAGRTGLADRAACVDEARGDALTRAVATADAMLADAVDRMTLGKTDRPLIVVGGGAFLVPDELPGVAEVIRPDHGDVANAVGAAIALVSGTIETIVPAGDGRREAIDAAAEHARRRAVQAGADPAGVEVVEITEAPMSYLPEPALRLRVKAAGPLGNL
jgi:N-methylhydantoinase A/oxoprolinase/acetone carboxylase beta subunit